MRGVSNVNVNVDGPAGRNHSVSPVNCDVDRAVQHRFVIREHDCRHRRSCLGGGARAPRTRCTTSQLRHVFVASRQSCPRRCRALTHRGTLAPSQRPRGPRSQVLCCFGVRRQESRSLQSNLCTYMTRSLQSNLCTYMTRSPQPSAHSHLIRFVLWQSFARRVWPPPEQGCHHVTPERSPGAGRSRPELLSRCRRAGGGRVALRRRDHTSHLCRCGGSRIAHYPARVCSQGAAQ